MRQTLSLLKLVVCCLILMVTVAGCQILSFSKTASIRINSSNPQIQGPASFAANYIQAALRDRQLASISVTLELDSDLGEQAYTITRSGQIVTVRGGDARGLMYGGLELAERIRLNKFTSLASLQNKPFLARRGIKFNIPLDARTPSYADCGDAAQRNIAEMWNWDFWTEFLDNMALHRYNTLTLWNPHPFPSMTRIDGYEDVALNDVTVCTLDLYKEKHQWGPVQMVTRQVMDNLKVVKTMTIDEKIAFWRKVMAYAKDRGIDIYFITWNICPNSVAQPVDPGYKSWQTTRDYKEKPGKYGITQNISNPKTLAYYRKAVKTFVLTYPDLKGLGVTAGENMPPDKEGAEYTRERWLWEAYGLGILDAKKAQPDRKVHFIHRVWCSDMGKIMKYWGQYPDPFDVSFKYAKARLYSSPNIPFDDPLLELIKPYDLKSWWNLRNDDIFYHRWGDPDYVRDFLKNFPQDLTAGYHMGSDGYVWGREFVNERSSGTRELEISKHWYKFMLWGRLGYDPTLDRDFFLAVLKERFPHSKTAELYDSWQAASRIIPLVNRFHWRNWDFMWAVEGCKDGGGYHTVKDFYDNPTMEKSGILNPKDYVTAVLANKTLKGITPLEIADQLDQYAKQGDRLGSAGASGGRGNVKSVEELLATQFDCQGMALLGRFYADKIRATVAYGFFVETGKDEHKKKAVEHLQAAGEHWRLYAMMSASRYRSQVLARTGTFDWQQFDKALKDEIAMVMKLETEK